MNYVTNAQLCEIVRSNLDKVPHAVDGVIGIPRGGVFIGAILSEYLNVPLYTVDGFLSGLDLGAGVAGNGLRPHGTGAYIVADDSASTGASFREAREKLSAVPSCAFVYVAAVCDDRDVPDSVDIVLSHVREFRLFELNVFRTDHVSRMVFDIQCAGAHCLVFWRGIEKRHVNVGFELVVFARDQKSVRPVLEFLPIRVVWVAVSQDFILACGVVLVVYLLYAACF